jgi:predicted RND superfamily exporter protein
MDCVVFLRDHTDYDEPYLREHATQWIDARQASKTQSTAGVEQGVPVAIGSGPLQVIYTGAVPVVYKAQRALLGSLVQSTLWAFALIAAVMAWLLNPGCGVLRMLHPRNLGIGLVAGLIAMLPNIFPLVVVFGAMGFMGIPIDIGVMMTSCVALGVAVDDTIHFTTWFREGLSVGLSRQAATVMAYRRVGSSMMQTTLVCGFGMFVFALSTFAPTMRFGVMMLVMLLVALVGDLVYLPALLNGYWGKYFLPKEKYATGVEEKPQLGGTSLAIPAPHFRNRAKQEQHDAAGLL